MAKAANVLIVILASLIGAGYYLDPHGEVIQELTGFQISLFNDSYDAINNDVDEVVQSEPEEVADDVPVEDLEVTYETIDDDILFPEPEPESEPERAVEDIMDKIESEATSLEDDIEPVITEDEVKMEETKETVVEVTYESEEEVSRKEKDEDTINHAHNIREAMFHNDLDKFIRALKAKPELAHERDTNGWTILHEIVRFGNFEMTQYLVETCNANIHSKNGKDGEGDSVLDLALSSLGASGSEIVRYLKDFGAISSASYDDRIVEDDLPEESDNGDDVDVVEDHTGTDSRTLALKAVFEEDVHALEVIFKAQPELGHTTDKNGWTILHEAARRGNIEIIKLTVELGLSFINAVNDDGDSALDLAMKHLKSNDNEVLEYLRGVGALQNNYIRLHDAFVQKNAIAMDVIFKTTPEIVHATDKNGWTILHEATRSGDLDIVKLIVDVGNADVYAKNRQGHTALDIALGHLKESHPEVVHYLEDAEYGGLLGSLKDDDYHAFSAILKHRPDLIRKKDGNGWTILHEVVRKGNVPMMEILEEYVVDFNLKTANGGSPLYLAQNLFASDGHPMVKFLIDRGAISIATGEL